MIEKLLPICREFKILQIECFSEEVVVEVKSLCIKCCCPLCGTHSCSYHSCYYRYLQDLEIQKTKVKLKVLTHKYYCKNKSCRRKIFSEDLSGLCLPYSRFTHQALERIKDLSLECSSLKSVYLLSLQGLKVSSSTLLRLLHGLERKDQKKYYHIAIDDFAYRKGRRYYSIILDQLTGKVIEILPDRQGESLQNWLVRNPQVISVTRDRAVAFESAITKHLPSSIQIADRFHLIKNLSDELIKYIRKEQKNQTLLPLCSIQWPSKDEIYQSLLEKLCRIGGQRKYKKVLLYVSIHRLLSEGKSIPQIAGELTIKTAKVYKYSRIHNLKELLTEEQKMYFKGLPEIADVISQGFIDTTLLQEKLSFEITSQMLAKLTSHVRKDIQNKKREIKNQKQIKAKEKPSAKEIFKTFFDETYRSSHPFLSSLYKYNKHIHQLKNLCVSFRKMINHQHTISLSKWINRALEIPLEWISKFVHSIQGDFDAVQAAIDIPFSNALAEGAVCRVKCIKRQMYGRASLNLLKNKIILARFG